MSPLSPSFVPRTLVNINHEGDLAVTLRLVRSLELSNSLDLEILVTVRGVDAADRRVLTEGLRGRASLLELPNSASDADASNAAIRACGRPRQSFCLAPSCARMSIEPWTLGHLTKRLNALPECAVVAPLGRGRGRKRSVDVDALPYAGSLFRVAAWEAAGPFRESDQHGGDAAWCARVGAAGWRVMRTSPGKPRPPDTKRRSESPTPNEPGRLRGAVELAPAAAQEALRRLRPADIAAARRLCPAAGRQLR